MKKRAALNRLNKIIVILDPMKPDERKRVLKAAFAFYGAEEKKEEPVAGFSKITVGKGSA